MIYIYSNQVVVLNLPLYAVVAVVFVVMVVIEVTICIIVPQLVVLAGTSLKELCLLTKQIRCSKRYRLQGSMRLLP